MSSYIFFFLCIQICFIHTVYSQCLGAAGVPNAYGLGYGAGFAPAGVIAPAAEVTLGSATPGAYGLAIAPGAIAEFPTAIEMGAYGGAGIGDVVIAGEMPVAGTTLVTGQVPILGAVRFAGNLPAAGTVSISGSCGCGGGAYIY